MGIPKEANREWIIIGDHIHYDKSLDSFGVLRKPIIDEVDRLRRQTKIGHTEVVPLSRKDNGEISSILIRGETPEGPIQKTYPSEELKY